MLRELPFVQSITSAREIGGVISSAILASDNDMSAASYVPTALLDFLGQSVDVEFARDLAPFV